MCECVHVCAGQIIFFKCDIFGRWFEVTFCKLVPNCYSYLKLTFLSISGNSLLEVIKGMFKSGEFSSLLPCDLVPPENSFAS